MRTTSVTQQSDDLVRKKLIVCSLCCAMSCCFMLDSPLRFAFGRQTVTLFGQDIAATFVKQMFVPSPLEDNVHKLSLLVLGPSKSLVESLCI